MKLLVVSMLLTVSGLANAFAVNEDFETGDLSDWTATGQVGVQTDYVYQGTYSAYIGTVDHVRDDLNDYSGLASTDDLNDHSLSQVIDISNPSLTEIWVHYNFFTWDYDIYDDPGFQILVDGVVDFSQSAGAYSSDDDGLDSSGWLTHVIDLSGYTGSTITLEFNAGNTFDTQFQSWAYIEVTSVPVPGAVWLLGSALGFLGFARRR